MNVLTTARFRRSRRRFSERDAAIDAAMVEVADRFGEPHLHSGLGIRHLRRNYYECRVGLDLRLIFRAEKTALVFHLAGNHEEVRRFLKGI